MKEMKKKRKMGAALFYGFIVGINVMISRFYEGV